MTNPAVGKPGAMDRLPVCIAVIAVVCISMFAWTFRPGLDMNGDSSQYYIYATSLVRGEGYSDLSTPGHPPSNGFPPGYPLLMTPLRMLTDSVVAQKVLNGAWLLGAALLLFMFLRRVVPQRLALTAVLVSLLNYRVLQFATIMMSETSYLFFSALAVWLLYLFDIDEARCRWWKNRYFYLLILVVGYGYMIRTQGIALAAGVTAWLLCRRKWGQAASFVAGFAATTLPWTIRNMSAGLGASRYLGQMMAVDVWQPDLGTVTVGEMVRRGLKTLQMLITKAIPDTVTPYVNTDYAAATSAVEWLTGIALAALILAGFRRMKRYFWFFTAYSAAVLGVVCLWSAPSGSRYIVTLVPILEIGLTVGVYTSIETAARRMWGAVRVFSPLWLMIPAVVLASGRLRTVARESRRVATPEEAGFLDAARTVREHLPAETVVCCRKPSVFYVCAGCYVCNFIHTEDDVRLIRGLIESGVDYVVLDRLGYAATGRYLYPAIKKHRELFEVVGRFRVPQTCLLRFDRRAAEAEFGYR